MIKSILTAIKKKQKPISFEQNEQQTEYIDTGKMIYRTDNQLVSDEEIPHLIEIGYEKILEQQDAEYRMENLHQIANTSCTKFSLIVIDSKLDDQEVAFFEELNKKLSEIQRSISIKRMSNGAISIYSRNCYARIHRPS